jgi:hypothetical protein
MSTSARFIWILRCSWTTNFRVTVFFKAVVFIEHWMFFDYEAAASCTGTVSALHCVRGTRAVLVKRRKCVISALAERKPPVWSIVGTADHDIEWSKSPRVPKFIKIGQGVAASQVGKVDITFKHSQYARRSTLQPTRFGSRMWLLKASSNDGFIKWRLHQNGTPVGVLQSTRFGLRISPERHSPLRFYLPKTWPFRRG